jgi:hypothetical protein
MRHKIILALLLTAFFSAVALAETKSDYDRNFDFSKLRGKQAGDLSECSGGMAVAFQYHV